MLDTEYMSNFSRAELKQLRDTLPYDYSKQIANKCKCTRDYVLKVVNRSIKTARKDVLLAIIDLGKEHTKYRQNVLDTFSVKLN